MFIMMMIMLQCLLEVWKNKEEYEKDHNVESFFWGFSEAISRQIKGILFVFLLYPIAQTSTVPITKKRVKINIKWHLFI